jgi:ABC-type sugar transport system permease subunit
MVGDAELLTPLKKLNFPKLRKRTSKLSALAMLTPSLILYAAFVAGPLVTAMILTFFKWDLITPPIFIGMENYVELLSDVSSLRGIANSFVFAFWSVVLHLFFGLLFAIWINSLRAGWLQRLTSAAVFFPFLLSWAAASLIWQYALDPNFGFVNYYLTNFGFSPPNWFADATTALGTIILVDLWKTLGYTMVILLAGLQSIPVHYYEAAKIDGAGPIRRLCSITIPLLSPTLLFASVISFIGAFQIFEPMFIITKGGPQDSTLTVVLDVYFSAFRDFNMGYASVKSLLIVAVILAATFFQLRIGKRWVNYDR